jgi:tRNA A-37 threonylcarbamoyl transferase component Bud32
MSFLVPTGTIIDDRFEILTLIGQGGLGAVYRARQMELERIVAIKFLHAKALSDEESQERFRREGLALVELRHKNFPVLYHFGIWQAQVPYIAMEYLQGKTLRQELIELEKLPWARALQLAGQVCEAMDYAHQSGIVHRDLKPENLILTDDAGSCCVKICDFGLAKFFSDSQAGKAALTATGVLIGSVHYMSPEQCLGRKADPRSDIYSLACMLYEMLSGKRLFDAETAIAVINMHVSEPVPALSGARQMPAGLEGILRKALSKEPGERQQSMKELQDDLSLVAEGKGSAFKLSNLEPKSRKAITIALVCIAVAVLLVRPILMRLNRAPASCELELATRSRQTRVARDIAALKARPAKSLTDLFALGRAQLKSQSQQDIADAVQTYTEALGRCLPGSKNADRRAACFALRAKAEWLHGRPAESQRDFEAASVIASKVNPDHQVLLDIALLRIPPLIQSRKFVEALEQLNQAEFVKFDNYDAIPLAEKADVVDEAVSQRLDKPGDSRIKMINDIAIELRKTKPQSESESVDICRLANRLVKVLHALARDPQDDKITSLPTLQYSADIILKVPGHADLKKETTEELKRLNRFATYRRLPGR